MEPTSTQLQVYLGVDENVLYNGSLNKDRIRSEYFRRVGKI